MASSSTSRTTGTASRPSLAPPASSSTVHRRHSLFGTEDRIILDIGSRLCKVGFSGEAQPRRVFRTVELAARPGVEQLYDGPNGVRAAPGDDEVLRQDALLWDLNLMRAKDAVHRRQLLKAKVTVLLKRVYQEVLMVDPTQRRVIIVENPLTPIVLRQIISAVLFDVLKVSAVSPVISPLLSTLSIGSMTAVVLSVGVLETTVLPIDHGRPILSHFATTSRAGRSLQGRLRALLLRYGRLVNQTEGSNDSTRSTGKVTRDVLTQAVLEDVLVRACFVAQSSASNRASEITITVEPPSSPSQRRKQRRENVLAATDKTPDWQRGHTGDRDAIVKATEALHLYDEADDVKLLQRLRARYEASSTCPPIAVALPSKRDAPGPEDFSIFPTSPSTFELPSGASRPGKPLKQHLIVPGWIRERVADFFWDDARAFRSGESRAEDIDDGDDEEEGSCDITNLVLGTLCRLPIDMRRRLAGSILVTGGPASLPGFTTRVRKELQARLDAIPDVGEGARHSNEVHLDGTHVGGKKAARGNRTGRRNDALYASFKQLRDYIAVLNDENPNDNDDNDESQDDERTGSRGGTAAAIPPALHAWYGASLVGALKLSSVETMKREDWDAIKAAKAAEHSQGGDQRSPGTSGTGVSSSRPALASVMATRGSFMGVVSGLETGSHGGLESVTRMMGRSSL
ncbi:unnamed protein product [Jaminaea pallidilutea]